jgi:hypothetical protein
MSNFRSEIYNKILLEQDSNTRKEMEKRLNELNCLYCFDLKTVWDPRDTSHQFFSRFLFNNNNFYVAACEHCGEHKFLFDTNDINQGNNSEYKRLERTIKGVESRIGELKRVSQNFTKTNENDFIKNNVTTCVTNKEPTNELPSYEVESNFFKQSVAKTNFSADVKKICEILSGILEAHIGIPNINFIKKIELSFQMETNNQKNEKVFYNSTEDNKFFTFILIKQIVKDKNGNVLSIFSGEKNLTEIECYYWIYKAKNSAAIDILLKKQQDAVENELNLMTEILDSHYNK